MLKTKPLIKPNPRMFQLAQKMQAAKKAFEEKIVAFIKDSVKIEEEEISLENFNKLFEQN